MEDPGHRRYEEDLAAYLLDALTSAEAREFEAHLRVCASCQAEERWLRAAVEVLPSSVEQVEPPAPLRKRLMSTVRAEAAADRGAERRGARGRRWSLLLRPATALAAVAIVVAGVTGYLIADGDGTATTTVAARPTDTGSAASGELVRTDESTVLSVRGLPMQRSGRVYQVWLARENGTQIEPSSLFVVDRRGRGTVAIPDELEGIEAVMVSTEPAGGSDKPTTEPVLRASLQ